MWKRSMLAPLGYGVETLWVSSNECCTRVMSVGQVGLLHLCDGCGTLVFWQPNDESGKVWFLVGAVAMLGSK